MLRQLQETALGGFVLTWASALLVATANTPEAKCALSLDEMNCVNGSLRDLPSAVPSTAKDVKFLESTIPVLRRGDLKNFPELTDFVCLDCQMTEIEEDALWDLKRLIRVELYGNDLTVIHPTILEKCPKAKDFVVSWNPTLVVSEDKPFLISTTLLRLDLSGNNLTNVFPATFSKLPRLQRLTLAGNQLRHLAPDVFLALKGLRYLDLSRNKLRSVTLSVFPNRVATLRLAWNPWHCDCSLYPTVQWSKTRDVEDDVRCFKPHRLKWRQLQAPNCTAEMIDAIRERKIIGGSAATAVPDKA